MKLFRRNFIKALGAGTLLSQTNLHPQDSTRNPSSMKNVLLIMADDLNLALSSWGHPIAKTPNVQRLAEMGVRFNNAFCPYPLCGPSRSSILTGVRPETLGMGTNEIDWRSNVSNCKTLPEIARQNGLETHRFGKITHQGMPEGSLEREEVLRRRSLPHTHHDPIAWQNEFGEEPGHYERKAKGTERVLSGSPHGGISLHSMRVENPESLPDLQFADKAVEFLASDKAQSPFFLGVGFMKPHVPFFAPEPYWDLYDTESIAPLLVDYDSEKTKDLPEGAFLRSTPHRGLDREDQLHLYHGYLASVSWMDAQLGRVLHALEESGQQDNTLIVFVADHGYHLGEKGHWDKMMLFEPSLRIPLIVADPRQGNKGQSSDALVESSDLYATICDLMGWKASSPEGTSLRPWIESTSKPTGKPAFAWIDTGTRKGYSIRTDRFRYSVMEKNGKRGAMLFDLENDPAEEQNLSSAPEYENVRRDLHEQLSSHFQKSGHPLTLTG